MCSLLRSQVNCNHTIEVPTIETFPKCNVMLCKVNAKQHTRKRPVLWKSRIFYHCYGIVLLSCCYSHRKTCQTNDFKASSYELFIHFFPIFLHRSELMLLDIKLGRKPQTRVNTESEKIVFSSRLFSRIFVRWFLIII